MDKIIPIFTGLPATKSPKDDDFVDRLSSRYTVVVLVAFAIVVTAAMWVGSPITCWVPQHFTDSHTKFTNDYCWVRNTYYLEMGKEIPKEHEHDQRQVIPYYQWMPFILLGQALFFYLPSVFWHGLNQKAGVDSDNILEAAHKFSDSSKGEERDQLKRLIVNQIHRFLHSRASEYYSGCRCDLRHILTAFVRPCGKRFGNYLALLYLGSKVLYICNVIAQMFLLNFFLGTEFNLYGFGVLGGAVRDHQWTESPGVAFPRVTFCDFKVRRLGNVHRYAVQCVLPINMYNEKMYMFLWFWIVFVGIMTVLDFFVWIGRYILRRDKVLFITNHLARKSLIDKDTPSDRKMVERFVDDYLRQDGAFLLRLIVHNTNNITVTEIMSGLWEKFIEWDRQSPRYDTSIGLLEKEVDDSEKKDMD